MKQIEVTITMRQPDDYSESYVDTVIADAICDKTRGSVEDIGVHHVLAKLPDEKKFLVCLNSRAVRNAQTFHGSKELSDEAENEALWRNFSGCVTIGYALAENAELAVSQIAKRYGYSDTELFALELKE